MGGNYNYIARRKTRRMRPFALFISGAVDAFTTVDLIAEKTNNTPRLFCMPEGVAPDQLKALIMRWLQREKTNLDYAATLLVWGAMKDAYGCS